MLFLTGGPNAAATWAYVAAACPDLRCLLLDRPGTGLSAALRHVPDAATLPGYLVRLSVDVRDALGLERAGIVGSSSAATPRSAPRWSTPGGWTATRCWVARRFVPRWRALGFFTLLRTPGLGRLLLAAPVTAPAVRSGLVQLGHRRSLARHSIPQAMLDWCRAWQRDTETMRNDAAMIVACGSCREGSSAGSTSMRGRSPRSTRRCSCWGVERTQSAMRM